jgi:hypothetical protein
MKLASHHYSFFYVVMIIRQIIGPVVDIRSGDGIGRLSEVWIGSDHINEACPPCINSNIRWLVTQVTNPIGCMDNDGWSASFLVGLVSWLAGTSDGDCDFIHKPSEVWIGAEHINEACPPWINASDWILTTHWTCLRISTSVQRLASLLPMGFVTLFTTYRMFLAGQLQ